jgi:subtilase family serine protease
VTGWGSNLSFLETIGDVYDPPSFYKFVGGAGGGESQYFPKPSWQHALKGKGRQVPDVSADADPFTGVPVIVTTGGAQELIAGVGGTSLATPIFSAIWAIADQYNGAPLGFAAPTIARLKKGEITDVVDTSDLSVDSLSGTVYDQSGSTFYGSEALFSGADPAIAQTNYLAAITPLPGSGIHNAFAIAFGADTSLTVGKGWDNVTGFGEPNGFPFIVGVSVKQ